LREVAGTCRTGLIIATGVPGLGEQVGEEFGFPACGLFSRSAHVSSLHAVAAAAGALQTGGLDLAVAGGAELGLDPVWLALQDRAGALGAGEMRAYAADPAGLLPGEGCGMVVLVRAADARAAGVPVYAEIAGWSTPPAGSERSGPVLLQAYQRAGVDPADVQLIEGQGIGTAPGTRRNWPRSRSSDGDARVTADTETARALSAAGRLPPTRGRGRMCWPGPPLVSGS
jgi:Beta-ketoacyl synthase, N-terminal domain